MGAIGLKCEGLSSRLEQQANLTGWEIHGVLAVVRLVASSVDCYMLPLCNTTSCMRRSMRCTACAPGTCTSRCRMRTLAPGNRCCTHKHAHTHTSQLLEHTEATTFHRIKEYGRICTLFSRYPDRAKM